jgi:hypothetical protein
VVGTPDAEEAMRTTTAEGYSYEPVPTVAGGPPYPPELAARSRRLLEATLALFPPGAGAGFVPGVAARYPVHAGRAERVAAAVGVDPADLLAANLCYDLLLGSPAMGCSTLALPGEGGPVLSRNMDWFPAEKIAKASCLIREEFGVNAGFVGMLGAVTGMSHRGFCVCLNAAFGGSDPAGYPVLLFLRHVLDTAGSYAEALEMATRERLMSGGIITVVGTRNEERAVVERTPTAARVRTAAADQPLAATNHFRALAAPEVCPRYEYMTRHAGKLPAAEILTSRSVLQEITAQHVVLCPATRRAEMYVPSHLLPGDVEERVTAADLFRFLA